jgi:hypothetical protein
MITIGSGKHASSLKHSPRPTPVCPALELETMPGCGMAMQRVEAWFAGEIVDRPPVRFMAHNAFLNTEADFHDWTPQQKQDRWFDVDYQVDAFASSIEGRTFHGETFPVFWPNLGPDVYAAFYGARLHFGEVTSWSEPVIRSWDDLPSLMLDWTNEYLTKLDQITLAALERCPGQFLVGYTDLHPGLDCAAAWRDPQQLCLDMIDAPEQVMRLGDRAIADFETIYDHFDSMLKARGQLSVSWMGIPSYGRMHIPSCDFSALISPAFFREFGLPILQREVKTMTHNIFHVDGPGVAKHLDAILSVPEIHALQWVQGVGDLQPIMQWVPFIRQLQARGIPLIVDLDRSELAQFIDAMDPHGLFLWVSANDEEEELALLELVRRWS